MKLRRATVRNIVPGTYDLTFNDLMKPLIGQTLLVERDLCRDGVWYSPSYANGGARSWYWLKEWLIFTEWANEEIIDP